MKQDLVPDPDVFRRWEEAVAANGNAASAPPDVQIITSKRRRIPAHSRILASVSPVLENVLDRPAKRGNSEMVIPIVGVPCDAVVAFLQFLYSGGRRWDVGEEEKEMMGRYGMQLLVLSHVYQVRWLKRACEEGLAERLSAEGVVDVLQLARQCDAAWLRLRCMKLIGKDFAAVEKSEAWTFVQAHDTWLELDILQFIHETDLDTDVMWFRNPLPRFFPDGDFQIACDQFIGNPLDRNNRPNGGFNFVKSDNRTIEFYKYWYTSREKNPGYHDQDVLNIIKYDSFIDEIGLEMRFLSTAFFGGLCEPSRNLNEVCTMHANCCIGLRSKINDLKLMLDDWRRYMSLPPALKRSRLPFWRVPKNCSGSKCDRDLIPLLSEGSHMATESKLTEVILEAALNRLCRRSYANLLMLLLLCIALALLVTKISIVK